MVIRKYEQSNTTAKGFRPFAQLARNWGYHESFHVSWLGKAGWKDWELKNLILEEDWTFFTRNSVDFRGPAEQPGSKGQYAGVQIHAGLICINGPARMSGKIQTELFAAVLDMIQETTPAKGDMVNEVIEVYLAEEGWGIRDRSLSVAQLGRVILIRQFTQMIRSLYALAL